MSEKIIIQAKIKKDRGEVWKLWTEPEHITHWNHASDDWHAPRAVNDLSVGGKFNIRMEAKDGSGNAEGGMAGNIGQLQELRRIIRLSDQFRITSCLPIWNKG
ncbi:MAG: SRPBCC domain-containing protein [Calditrichaceae bacterium]